MKAFHAYDIRGVYNRDFDKNDAYRIGFYLPQLLQTNKVLVGRDVRTSSPEIYEALTQGITDSGADVYNIGLSTTPMVYYTTATRGFDASVQITASHNPKQYNGMKISRTNALPVGYDTGLGELEKMIQQTPVPVAKKGVVHDLAVRDEYISFLKKYLPDMSSLKIAIDCSNGMAALLIKELLANKPLYLYDELDGTFPNHEANPLIPENVRDLQNLVTSNGCDVGAIFDGDADRVMFVDERGRFVSPDLIIALLGHYFLPKAQGEKIVLQDIRTSKAVGEYLAKHFGAKINTWRVGRAFAAPKLREIDGIYGGELAGHYYFRNFFYSDSGLLACLIVFDVIAQMKRQGKSFAQLIDDIKTYENSGEINFRIEQKRAAMDAVRSHVEKNETVTAFYDFDGYRIECAHWWLNIRPSNTEPYLRLLIEADSQQLLQQKVAEIKGIVEQFK